MVAQMYQVLPDLLPEEYDALKKDIAERGVMVPVEIDEDGNILDGHHRVRICKELDIPWPSITRGGMDDAGKRAHARQLNLARRHLNQEQRRALIADQLKETPETSDRQIATLLGVSATTVGTTRKALEEKGELSKLDSSIGADGKERPRNPQKPATLAIEFPEDADAAVIKAGNKAKRHKSKKQKQDRDERKKSIPPDLPKQSDLYRLIVSPINELSGHIEPDSVDWIITDPPYPKEYLETFNELATLAAHALRPGGSLICMAGQSYLPEVMSRLGHHLNYHWTLAYLTPGGQSAQIWPRKVNTFWKPLLWYVSGEYSGDWIGDVCSSKTNDNDKEHHYWGQSESGMADIIERFTYPGDIILDPFLGGGTTGVVSVAKHRLFIGADIDQSCVEKTAERLAVHAGA